MKKNLLIIFCLLMSINLFISSSYACSMGQIDEEKQYSDLQRFALTALEVYPDEVFKIKITNTELDYIWSGPQCPEGIRAAGTFHIQFVETLNAQDTDEENECFGIVRVSKTEPTGLSQLPIKHELQIEILEKKNCQGPPAPTSIPTREDPHHSLD